MITVENTVIQPLTENNIIRDPSTAKTILAYVELVQDCTGKELGELEIGDVYCCAWFAIEHLGHFPCSQLQHIHVESYEGARDFIERLIGLRRLLLERAAVTVVAKNSVDHIASSDGPYTAPGTYSRPCSRCTRSGWPCIKVLTSTQCLSCFLMRLAHCNKWEGPSQGTRSKAVRKKRSVAEEPRDELRDTHNLPVPAHTSHFANGDRPLTAKKPRIGLPDASGPSEVATPSKSVLSDDDEDEYIPSADPDASDIDARRSQTRRTTWTEKKHQRKEQKRTLRSNSARDDRVAKTRGTRSGREAQHRRHERCASLRSAGRDGQNPVPTPQKARRSSAFPKSSSKPASSNSTTSNSASDGRLPSPPPSGRRLNPDKSEHLGLRAPPLPRLLAGDAEQSECQPPACSRPTSCPEFLSADIRKFAERMVEFNEEHPCDHKQLYVLIKDLKIRLNEHTELTSMADVEPQGALDSELVALEDDMLTKEREIATLFRTSKQELRTQSAVQLRLMIADLDNRLAML